MARELHDYRPRRLAAARLSKAARCKTGLQRDQQSVWRSHWICHSEQIRGHHRDGARHLPNGRFHARCRMHLQTNTTRPAWQSYAEAEAASEKCKQNDARKLTPKVPVDYTSQSFRASSKVLPHRDQSRPTTWRRHYLFWFIAPSLKNACELPSTCAQ